MKRLMYAALSVWALAGCDQSALPPTSPQPPKTAEAISESVPTITPAPVTKSVAPKPAAPKSPAQAPAPELDLSVSKELIDSLQLAQPTPAKPLLPALIDTQTVQVVRLNGRLITSQEPDKLIDGAELSLEIKN